MYRNNQKGFAAIIVLAAAAIIILLYFIQIKTIIPVAHDRGDTSVKVDRPWLEEELIVPDDKLIRLPEPPKPDLGAGFTTNATVSRQGSKRGIAKLKFGGGGDVSGTWNCSYTHDNRLYSYEADFNGNISAGKTFSDKTSGKDESLLFFITKGTYTQTTLITETGEKSETSGTVYVTGWLDRDHSVKGLVTIRKDKSWSATYELSAMK